MGRGLPIAGALAALAWIKPVRSAMGWSCNGDAAQPHERGVTHSWPAVTTFSPFFVGPALQPVPESGTESGRPVKERLKTLGLARSLHTARYR
ncbi:MAG: hypothetical protein R3E56_02455 [Burkholderiaceae bacterium]